MMMHVEFGMARKFIDDLSENVQRGLRARIARGWAVTRPPPGYMPDRNTHTIVKDPERAPLLRRAIELVLAGNRPSEAVRVLNDVWGYRTPRTRCGGKPLARSRFYDLLGNSFYCGLLRFKGEIYQGAHEALVSPQEFAQIQTMLRRENRPRPSRHEWAYTGLLRCAACGSTLVAGWSRSHTGRRYAYYWCRGRSGCEEPGVRAEDLDAQFHKWLSRLRLPDPIVAWYLDTLDDLGRDRTGAEAMARASREKARRLAEQQLRNLTELRLKDLVGDEEYVRQRQRLLAEQKALAAPMDALNPVEPARAVISLLNQAPELFLHGDTRVRRAIVEAVALNPRLGQKRLVNEAQKPFALLREGPQIPAWQGL